MAMHVKPADNSLGLFPRRHMVTGKIAEALVILENHAAVLLAIPQASLGLDVDIIPPGFRQHVLHMTDQRFTAGPAFI